MRGVWDGPWGWEDRAWWLEGDLDQALCWTEPLGVGAWETLFPDVGRDLTILWKLKPVLGNVKSVCFVSGLRQG